MSTKPVISFMAEETEVILDSYQAAKQWLADERAAWEFLWTGGVDQNLQSIGGESRQHLDRLNGEVVATENRADVTIAVLSGTFAQAYGAQGALFHSKSQHGAELLSMRAAAGDEAARFAHAFLRHCDRQERPLRR